MCIRDSTRPGGGLAARAAGSTAPGACEPSPAPTKWALSQLGRCSPRVRLPIVPLTAGGQAQVGQALRDSGLLG